MKPPPGHVSVPEAQKMLGIARQRMYQLIDLGRIPSKRVGKRRFVPIQAINARMAAEARLNGECIAADEVADFFGVDVKTVREWHTQGHMKASRIQNRLCFDLHDVTTFIPPTVGGVGRYPARPATRTLRGQHYPLPDDHPDSERNT